MTHPDSQELVMHAFGDAENDHVAEHLETCPQCAAEVREVLDLLEVSSRLLVPEPDAGFEERIWQRQRQHLPKAAVPDNVIPFWSLRRAGLYGALAASLLLAFTAGLYNSPPGMELIPEADAGAPDRVLFVAVGDHLESARMVLLEVANSGDLEALGAQRMRAESLVQDSRVFRQTASFSGQTAVAELLDELERVLLEVARTSDAPAPDELAWLQRRIASGDLLFRVNVVEGQVRESAGLRTTVTTTGI